jgi:predicted nucleotidyltransferase
MLSDADRDIARELLRRVATIVPVLDFVVFGSRARGDALLDADLDVFIVVRHVTPKARRQISEAAWEVGFNRDRLITTIVATHDQLGGILSNSPLLLNIRREGVRP